MEYTLLTLFIGLCLSTVVSSAFTWNYNPFSKEGPKHWGNLTDLKDRHQKSPDAKLFPFCDGSFQSPVNIPAAAEVIMNESLYPVTSMLKWPSIHKLTFMPMGGNFIIWVEDEDKPQTKDANTDNVYELKQFHFHSPSEHTFYGRTRDMEMHMVHAAEDKSLMVISVSFVVDSSAVNNEVLMPIWKDLPPSPGRHLKPKNIDLDPPLRLQNVFPKSRNYVTYPGSLTTPPCTQGVTWYVFDEPIPLSKLQLYRFRQAMGFPLYWRKRDPQIMTGNARPPQPLNGRQLQRFVDPEAPPPEGVLQMLVVLVGVLALVSGVWCLTKNRTGGNE